MYRSCGSVNSGSPYRRATATLSITSGRGSGRACAAPSISASSVTAGADLLGLGLVDVRLLRHVGLAPLRLCLAVDRLVPQQGPAGALLVLERGLLRLQFLDELGDVG